MRSVEDIDFSKLNAKQFEELCFDLLFELGFKNLVWRQGGADNGRDIQGRLPVPNPLVDPFDEHWFFECKHYEAGVPPVELNSKIAWADAEKPKHFVFFVSSYITTPARTWLDAIRRDKFYRIHLIEGKQLQHLIVGFDRLVVRHFSSDNQKLMQEAQRAWVIHNLIPEPGLLRALADSFALEEYDTAQIAFLWSAMKMRFRELDANMADSESQSYDSIFSILRANANTDSMVLNSDEVVNLIQEEQGWCDYEPVYPYVYASQFSHVVDRVEYISIYCIVWGSDGEAVEVLVDQNSSFTYRIRHIRFGAKDELGKAKEILRSGI
jgi:Restriction endonuclease